MNESGPLENVIATTIVLARSLTHSLKVISNHRMLEQKDLNMTKYSFYCAFFRVIEPEKYAPVCTHASMHKHTHQICLMKKPTNY